MSQLELYISKVTLALALAVARVGQLFLWACGNACGARFSEWLRVRLRRNFYDLRCPPLSSSSKILSWAHF